MKKKYHQIGLFIGIVIMSFLIINGSNQTEAAQQYEDENYFAMEQATDAFSTMLTFPRQLWNLMTNPIAEQLRVFLRSGFTINTGLLEIVPRIGDDRNLEDEFYMLTWQPEQGFVRRENLIHEQNNDTPPPDARYINSNEPLVYIFNAHPSELIGAPSLSRYREGTTGIVEFSHMLANIFSTHRIPVLVEDRDVRDVIRENGWRFDDSYRAARIFLEERIHQYPSLQFFFDIHRDAVPDSVATVTIDGKDYARVMFVIGIDNPQFEENSEMALKLHEMLEERKPGISRGIFPSGGPRRNGWYNQDLSPKLQLVEIGSAQSTITEMTNATEILAEVIAEYILNYME